MSKKNNNGDDGGFFKCVLDVLKHLEPIDALLEHPVFQAHLRRICAAHAFNWADADELFNDVCLKLTRKIDQFDPSKPDANFVGWLRKMVRNAYIDRLRRHSPLELDNIPSDERYDLIDRGASPYEQLWQRELNKELNKFIAEQEEDLDRLILTYYFQDLSLREIRDVLETKTTHVTVRNTFRRLLKEFFRRKMSIPDVHRKANKPSKPPVIKAKINRKAAKVSKRKGGTRRLALKK